MGTKQSVLSVLEKHKGESVSGSKLSQYTGVSRTAVWKAINDLRNDGYSIEAMTNRGYTLSEQSNILSPESISPYLKTPYTIEIHDTVESTSTLLKQMATNGSPDKTVVIANRQTGGRGRRGNSFFSPKGSGIYISILLRPQNIKSADAPIITTAAATAVCRAVDSVCKKSLQIKWINDLFFNDKKVCGILTEAATDFETGFVEYIIIGIGLNILLPQDGIPDELEGIIGYICDEDINRGHLCAEILNNITQTTSQIKNCEFLDEYCKRSLVIGKEITVRTTDEYTARAVGINDHAELIIQLKNGEIKTLNSGEISINLK